MKQIDIILPVYNEESILPYFHEALEKVTSTLRDRYSFSFIYVVDKSSDQSLGVLRALCKNSPQITVLSLSKRFGHQMSLVAGMDHAKGDAVIMMDTDLEHPPEVIPKLLLEFEKGFEIVYTVRKYNEKNAFTKKFFSKAFYRVIRKLSGMQIEEGAADYRLISSKVLRVFSSNIREQNQFLRGLFEWVGFKKTRVVFTSNKRSRGKSKYSTRRLINFAILGITSFSKLPLRFAMILGLTVAFGSILYGIWVVIGALFFDTNPEGWTSLIVIATLLGGVQLMFMGIIGEYLGVIFDETKHRPLYIVEEKFSSDAHD